MPQVTVNLIPLTDVTETDDTFAADDDEKETNNHNQ